MNEQVSNNRFAAGAVAAATPPALPASLTPQPLSREAETAAAALHRHSISRVVVGGAAKLAEFTLVIATGVIVELLYVEDALELTWPYIAAIFGVASIYVAAMQIAGGYSISALRRAGAQVGRLLAAWVCVFALMTTAAFIAKLGHEFSRAWFGLWFLCGLAALLSLRAGMAALVARWTRERLLERRAVIVGGGERAENLINALKANGEDDIRICGIFDDRDDSRSPRVVAGYRKLGTIVELVEFARRAQVDMLIVSLPFTAEKRLLHLLKSLSVLPVDIRLAAHTDRLRFRPRTYSFVGEVPFLDVADKPIADWNKVTKWLFDHVVGGLILLLAAPVMLLVALAIRLDSPGPVLFRQKRYGFNNDLIEVFKFRSMYVDQSDANAARLVTKGDPRVTRVGRFIRKASIDELPQLFNVIFKGNLSLVGPRPHAVQAKASNRLYNEVVDGYFARHRVKPGITGWAQVNGWRGETDTEEKLQRRVEHDLYYIENWSVLFDLYIVLITPFRLFQTENAY